MIVRPAQQQDRSGLLALAAQVEHWFGPMVDDPGFHSALDKHISRGMALVAVASGSAVVSGAADSPESPESPRPDVLGGLLFGAQPPTYHLHWLVVSERERGTGIGRALLADAQRRFVRGPGHIEVVTFGIDHPGAVASGARVFYERLGFTAAEPTTPGPEGGSRQIFRLAVA